MEYVLVKWYECCKYAFLFFFWFFLLLGTKHLHVLQWVGRSSGNYIVEFLPCPQSDLGHYCSLGHPNYTIRSTSPLIWDSFMKPPFGWSTTFDLPSGHKTHFGKPCLDPIISYEIVNFGLQDYVHKILASNFMNIRLLDVTSMVCGEKSPPCAVVATSSITINLNIVKSIKRQNLGHTWWKYRAAKLHTKSIDPPQINLILGIDMSFSIEFALLKCIHKTEI